MEEQWNRVVMRRPRKLNVTHAIKARESIGLLYITKLICASKDQVPNTGGKLEKGLELQIKVEQILVIAYTDIIKLISIILEQNRFE